MIYCPIYKIEVNEEYEGNCPGCIFWREVPNKFGYKYYRCLYKEWYPGLKRGRDTDALD